MPEGREPTSKQQADEFAAGEFAPEAYEFERLLADVAAQFVNAQTERVDEVIPWALGQLCSFLGGERAGVFLLSSDGEKFCFAYQWAAKGFENAYAAGAEIPSFKIEWVTDQLRRGKVVMVPNVSDLPEEAVVYQHHLEEVKLKATMNVPITVDGSFAGMFGFGSETEPRDWPESLLSRLTLVGQVFSDALARKRFKEGLMRAEQRFRLAAELAFDMVYEIDLTTRQVVIIGDFESYTGYPIGETPVSVLDEEALAWWSDHMHPDDREEGMGTFQKCMTEGGDHEVEFRFLGKDGGYRHWVERLRGLKDEKGSVTRLVGTVSDVTARKRAEKALGASEEMYRAILDSIPEEVVVLDRDGRIVSVNDAWNRFALENDIESTKTIEPGANYLEACQAMGSEEENTARRAAEGVRAVLDGKKKEFTMEYPCDRPGGHRLWFIMQVVPLRKRGGGAVVSHTDVTHLKKSQEELRQALDEIAVLKDQLEEENVYLKEHAETRFEQEDIAGESSAIQTVLRKVEQVAPTESNVLILGETGTGKELVATAIHGLSGLRHKTMVKVNCGALPSNLIESELFGREAGAYTGATTKQKGRFELADGSTIFLDEVGELPAEVQAKLLRVLQNGEFERLGSPNTIKVNVRLIAATNRDLMKEVEQGKFREDLFYRLNVFPVLVPPLRERVEDIPSLAWTFVKEFGEATGKLIEKIPKGDMERLQGYSWPGNVRELRNVIERAMILCEGRTLRVEVPRLSEAAKPRDKTLEEIERVYIRETLETCGWRVRGRNGAAEILGLNEATLRSRMKKLGIKRPL